LHRSDGGDGDGGGGGGSSSSSSSGIYFFCKFHCFTMHFDSLSFIHTNSCTFSYNYVSVF